ncbi:heparan-alpha-glucosaminide N-acetyltransferase domain-containing protein [Homoserinibacter sp. YIM 151385]|uniref:heparan-alpha-glucosaminide N-acetyltransferase domain-containing protein n=1 Tax=Homoserinibacter sp. YIM 151385 TaxID=2985506 RepID=UPI0022F0CCB9|nr:heparan-alpha-glucosaminide N-acetyltransferase domain-containing protein [Homoserinibacter sp. YIM 151385]WBU38866.1 heparan-alpha-glucosaminide N-acetyltransferase domain-containing protein [Homoserinibacter sp. YIM 151385]
MTGAALATPSAGWAAAIRARLAAFGRPPRILGVDLARGLAVLGMFGAHVGVTAEELDATRPETWTAIVDGRSAILFALLAGVSIAILSGGAAPVRGEALLRARLRVLARGGTVLLLGLLLELLGTGVAVILPVYGALFVLSVLVLGVRVRWLLAGSAALALLAPVAVTLVGPDTAGSLDPLLLGVYPVPIWMSFVLTGMAVGRLDLRSLRVRVMLAVAGLALMGLGYGLGGALAASAAGPFGAAQTTGPGSEALERLGALLTIAPHSGSPFEVLGSTGFALAALALCLAIARSLRWPLLPLAALGSMPLSAYIGHLLAIAALLGTAGTQEDQSAWLAFSAVALAACALWMVLLGRGPVERLLALVADLASGDAARRLRRGDPGSRL